MQAFNELRHQARIKRDKALAKIHEDYAATIARIAVVEQDLLGLKPPGHKPISECVARVLPTDRVFTIDDVVTALQVLEPRRNWRKWSIGHVLGQLREKGLVRRVTRSKVGMAATYARIGVPIEDDPYRDVLLVDVVAEVLEKAGRPLNLTEVTVAVQGTGYKSSASTKNLRGSVSGALSKDARFIVDLGKWSLVK